ncbi:tRNA 2-selenouridine(34) synthase MnmH [Lusitaniella coriacea LEGE 07157]|uniref:tRNA 2-selenouridine(34) synthase MnmH n=1 Tax=Lusitaniella coriacea LEGE 07157 TaxID=945747 RepID=A0A8J7E2X0_9CYAN|nr:tRNA 2-selenouridine(34) synthase MnmH [Lusitaniella coriacea]MBE9118796.1 tRNA 2-selenouridine(34) synthase MnmH [Lusitaniella coriacea LEGE 07157]
MTRLPAYTKTPWQHTYSEIIDVRSEEEYQKDCIPGAINLPVLNDRERKQVGTIYKQVSPFEARKIGSALISKNISCHLESHFACKDKSYQPLIYCWRGGQRSGSLALVLSQIGWKATVVEGGYKTYRSYVREQLESLPKQLTYKVVCGLTGTGKTLLLERMKQRKWQVLDLEALAHHRGSLLGQEWTDLPEQQPTQKAFESRLLQSLKQFNPDRIVWLESESNKIGQVYLPKVLWDKMQESACIEICLPIEKRIDLLLQQYPYLTENPEFLKNKLIRLKSRYGGEKIKYWCHLVDTKEWRFLIQDLLEVHYDPAYSRSMQYNFKPAEQSFSLTDLSDASINAVLDKITKDLPMVRL